MGALVHLAAAALVTFSFAPHVAYADTPSCTYMTEIPRPPTPNFPNQDFSGLSWSERPLLPAPRREDLCMDQWVDGTQIIFLEEEIEDDVTIAILNYKGDAAPEFGVMSGSLSQLGPVARRVGDEWHLVITERQDYEMQNMRNYMFSVRVPGEALRPTVSLQIVNIDDNPPVLEVIDPCQADELGEPRLTKCVYIVTDRDGEISTRFMTFAVTSDRGDDAFFRMVGTNIPGDWFTMHMTVEILQPLNIDTSPLHIFSVTAYDSRPNSQTVTMMVQVQNVPHRQPRWVEIFAVQQFNEKTVQQFPVRAIDGDSIETPVRYQLIRAPEDTFFSLEVLDGTQGAVLHVGIIDRDKLEKEVFQLSIIASKYDDESISTTANIVIIVNDVNDQRPEPLHPTYRIAIMEETPLTLNLEEFGFHDRDLGENAQYSVNLEDGDGSPKGVASAFEINPNVGYQRQTFILSTRNHDMLDYEVEEFQSFTIKVIATDLNKPEHVDVALVTIDLINWNDELPIFENTAPTATFKETVGAGFHVATVEATDRDIDDEVVHTLMGNAGEYLAIDGKTGRITVSVDDAFDFHRQNVLFVQVRADDTLGEPYNTATTQLIIQLEDVNNTPPTLRLPRGSPSVEENVPEGFEITRELTATDPDTTAKLIFEIDWETTWATKQGRETPRVEFVGCVDIETIYPQPENQGSAIGRLYAKEIRPGVTIDFEEFEVLHLTVRVRDVNTVLGTDYDESTFTVTIIDMNDNPPIYAAGSLEQELRVREVSASGVVIGTISATDIDGPLYNQVRYSIIPREDTPANLVKINFVTGQLTVDANEAIDADVPPRQYLFYTVVASDCCYQEDVSLCPPDKHCFNEKGEIKIEITDTNNREPKAETDLYDVEVRIPENSPNLTEVRQLFSSDLDRDEIYHTVRYQINHAVNSRLRVFFEVEPDTGLVYVHYTSDEVLDRDGDEPTHTIHLILTDNFDGLGDGRRNQYTTSIKVILLDENDNAPELPSPDKLSWRVSESLDAGIRLEPEIYAPDRDEPDTPNSHVGYEILGLRVTNRPNLELPELFVMIAENNVTGELETAMPLKGYWGTYEIHIKAFDHGEEPMSEDEWYQLVVTPYNFHAPVFTFPLHGTTIRLSRERAAENGLLATAAGPFLDRIHATDEDGLEAGTVTFQVQGNDEAVEFFDIVNEGDNYGSLQLLKLFPEEIREFRITIRATDGGTDPQPLWTASTLTVLYVPTQGDPVFQTSTATVAFFEGEDGLSESFQLPQAVDNKNYMCQDDCLNIYYRILEGNDEGLFKLDASTNTISLARELDREAATSYTLAVTTSNSPSASNIPLQASILHVTINVREANPRPIFDTELYTAGISTLDSIGRELFTVKARHSENDAVTYAIDLSTMVVDDSLSAVRDTAFVVNPSSGVLSLNMQPTAAMHGLFQFKVTATDTAGASDTADVQIYLISSLNRVFFLFHNTLEQVEQHRDFIATTLGTGFNMRCNIDQVVPGSGDDGVARDDRTEVRAHFIRDNAPVPASTIEELRSDTVLLHTIQLTLSTNLLLLQDFVTDASPDAGVDHARTIVYALAGLSALLGLLCVVLLLTFIFRTRALNRRLQALSMTKYGSVDSGLNRAGLAPGTNKHAVEGSNPIWNEAIKAPDFDAISSGSDDSDLIGIEDLPQFRSDYFPPGDTDSLDEIVNPRATADRIATHNNNFGFNTSPFSPWFTNQHFRR